jgi:hypothetical protein
LDLLAIGTEVKAKGMDKEVRIITIKGKTFIIAASRIVLIIGFTLIYSPIIEGASFLINVYLLLKAQFELCRFYCSIGWCRISSRKA